MSNQKRRPRKDRGKDDSIEIDLMLDVMERVETVVADLLDRVKDLQERV